MYDFSLPYPLQPEEVTSPIEYTELRDTQPLSREGRAREPSHVLLE